MARIATAWLRRRGFAVRRVAERQVEGRAELAAAELAEAPGRRAEPATV